MQKLLPILLTSAIIVGGFIYMNQEEKSYVEHLNSIAKNVNKLQTTWVANENVETWKVGDKEDFKILNGKKKGKSPLPSQPVVEHDKQNVNIPENFDARQEWNNCESIKEIRDQANCGSCWAFAAAEAFSDRWCIASGQKDQAKMSTQNLLTCCDYCGNGCAGGWDDIAWNYFQNQGVVSGNLYGQNQYCQSYSLAPCDHHVEGPLGPCPPTVQTPKCTFECSSEFKGTYAGDRYYTKSTGIILSDPEGMQIEIMTNGPVEGSFIVYEDFETYKSGVYQHVSGEELGGHAIKILGWGVEDGTPYWLCANSWNYSWGEEGFFKILRGQNECGIENSVSFGQPKIE